MSDRQKDRRQNNDGRSQVEKGSHQDQDEQHHEFQQGRALGQAGHGQGDLSGNLFDGQEPCKRRGGGDTEDNDPVILTSESLSRAGRAV